MWLLWTNKLRNWWLLRRRTRCGEERAREGRGEGTTVFCGIERWLIRARLHIEGATVFKPLLLVLKGSCRLGLDVPIGGL